MGGNKRALGLVVGLLGCALTGYALFSLLATTGGCTDARTAKDCVEGFEGGGFGAGLAGVWMLPAGIVAAVVGMFLGGGMIVFAGLFLAIGAGALLVGILGLMPDMPIFPWLFGGLFFLSGFIPFFLALFVRRSAAAKQVTAAELMRSGVRGVGTITGVGDTGVTINNNPRIVVTMRIEPVDGSGAVERRKTVTVSRVQIPQVGARYPAWFDRNDPDKWMYGTDMDASQAPAEVRDLFARAAAGAPGAPLVTGGPHPAEEASPVEELESLTALWKAGALTDSEFAAAKARLLARIGR